jgi:hypothetical protein
MENKHAQIHGQHEVRSAFKRLQRILYSKTFQQYPKKLIDTVVTSRTNKGEFESGSQNYAPSYSRLRRGKGLAAGKIKYRAKKERFKPSRANKHWVVVFGDYENGIKKFTLRPRFLQKIKDRLTGRVRNKKWTDVAKGLAARGINPYYITSAEEQQIIYTGVGTGSRKMLGLKPYFNKRAYPIFGKNILA